MCTTFMEGEIAPLWFFQTNLNRLPAYIAEVNRNSNDWLAKTYCVSEKWAFEHCLPSRTTSMPSLSDQVNCNTVLKLFLTCETNAKPCKHGETPLCHKKAQKLLEEQGSYSVYILGKSKAEVLGHLELGQSLGHQTSLDFAFRARFFIDQH